MPSRREGLGYAGFPLRCGTGERLPRVSGSVALRLPLLYRGRDKNWLILMEAAGSHGPVDATRYSELSAQFAESTAGLVYVLCFQSREEMRGYLAQITWETEVWCAD